MAEGHNQMQVVRSMSIRRSYLQKLIFPTVVMQRRRHLLPPMLFQGRRKATAILKSGRNRRFRVTFSLGRNHKRLVLLQNGWKEVVAELGLDEGDEVTISLEDRASFTYTIKLVKGGLAPVEGPQPEEADIYQGGDENHINLDQGGDAHATAAAASTSVPSSSSLQGGHNSAILNIDLNNPPVESDEEEIN